MIAVAALFGAVVGSFLNVVAHRLPRGGSLVRPPSACPGCRRPVRPYDNVPVVSWLVLRGRCRNCRGAISARYPLVEAATAVLFASVVAAAEGPAQPWLGLAFVTLLVPVALIDLDFRIIPNVLLGVGAAGAVVLLAVLNPGALPEHAVAAIGCGGFLLAAALARPGGMGMGDVKLAFVMGLFLGRAVVPALAVALVAGTLVGVAVIARRGVADGRRTAVPFGPFLGLGGVVGVLAGPALIAWYLSTFV